jgi:DNA-binding response OmpR family regulator
MGNSKFEMEKFKKIKAADGRPEGGLVAKASKTVHNGAVCEENRVLIAEDHYVSRHLLERNLTNWGFTVVTAQDGEEALSILESDNAPPLAILDWIMPKLDGLEVCARVRKHANKPYVYLVLLTAKSQKDEIAAGLRAGADEYVIKPFDPDELRARLTVGQRVVVLERALARKGLELESALAELAKLKGLIPQAGQPVG